MPSFNDMVVKACALALREFPRANGAYRDGRFELYSRVNVGVAVAAQDALVVPTVFDADRKGLRQIAADSRALAQQVRDGTITPPELSGGTFTVSNLGMYGIDNFSAVINTPQAAILAVGAIKERPVVRDGEIVPAQLMNVTLACDHRILYGADGAEFLARIRALLEEPVARAVALSDAIPLLKRLCSDSEVSEKGALRWRPRTRRPGSAQQSDEERGGRSWPVQGREQRLSSRNGSRSHRRADRSPWSASPR